MGVASGNDTGGGMRQVGRQGQDRWAGRDKIGGQMGVGKQGGDR